MTPKLILQSLIIAASLTLTSAFSADNEEASSGANLLQDFGAVIDINDRSAGFKVLSVKPDTVASQMNLKAGDSIVAVNGVEIIEANYVDVMSTPYVIKAGDTFRITIRQDGRNKTIKGVADNGLSLLFNSSIPPGAGVEIADNETDGPGCSQFSTLFVPPPDNRVYSATIRQIDGRNVVFNGFLQVEAGKTYTLQVYENIDPNIEFTLRRTNRGAKPKYLEVTVQPNRTYHIAAKFNPGQFRSHSQKYWEPVVWNVTGYNCEN